MFGEGRTDAVKHHDEVRELQVPLAVMPTVGPRHHELDLLDIWR